MGSPPLSGSADCQDWLVLALEGGEGRAVRKAKEQSWGGRRGLCSASVGAEYTTMSELRASLF